MNRNPYRSTPLACAAVAVAVLAFVAVPLRGQDKAKHTPKEIAAALDAAKMTLGKGIEAAEKETKGRAVSAWAEMYADGVRIDVHCVVGDKVMAVELDKTGKVLSSKEVKGDPHAHSDKDKAKTQGDAGGAKKP